MMGTYRRADQGDYRCSDDEVRRMLADQSDTPADSQVVEHFGQPDFDPETAKQCAPSPAHRICCFLAIRWLPTLWFTLNWVSWIGIIGLWAWQQAHMTVRMRPLLRPSTKGRRHASGISARISALAKGTLPIKANTVKLGTKLLAAPLLTALVVFSVGQLTLFLTKLQTAQVEKTILSQSDDYRTLSNAQEQIAQLHTGMYRNLGLIGSMEAAQITQLRESAKLQMEGFKRVVQGASGIAERDAASAQAIQSLSGLADQYTAQIDLALARSSAETGAGAGFAVMREADISFAKLAEATRALVQHVDEMSDASVAALQQEAQTIAVVLGLLGCATVIVAVWFSWRMQKSLVQALQHASAVATQVAQGNLSLQVDSARQDEWATF